MVDGRLFSTIPSYTSDPALPPGMVFPSHTYQTLSCAVTLVGITVLTYCFARRSDYEGIWTIKGLKELTWPKICILLLFMDSWAFIFSAGLLMLGAGLSTSVLNCSLAIFSCILLYAVSKLFIYLFLIEKVFIVWAPHGTAVSSRWSSKIFQACMTLLIPLVIILVVLIFGRVASLRSHDRVCIIGLKKYASLALLCYDLFMTLVLTSMFIYPLWRSDVTTRLRRVASRTLVASCVALATSCANVAILTVLHGQELGWVCLSSCGTDVTINAIALYWVTNTQHKSRPLSHAKSDDRLAPPGKFTSASVEDVDRTSVRHARVTPNFTAHGEPVPASILAGRVTHFADDTRSHDGGERERMERRQPGWWRSVWNTVWGGHGAEEHSMSVQVTVTTEHQLPRGELDMDLESKDDDSMEKGDICSETTSHA